MRDSLTFRNSGELTWLGLKDGLRGTHRAEELWSSRTIDRLRPPCTNACRALEQASLVLQDDLTQALTEFHVSLARAFDQLQEECPDFNPLVDDMVAAVGGTFPQFMDIANTTATVPLSFALEGALTATTGALISGKASGTVAGAVSTSWVPFADGPLPFADIAWGAATVGLAAYDATRWVQARGSKREELRQALQKAVTDTRERALGLTREHRDKLLAAYRTTLREQSEAVCGDLQAAALDLPVPDQTAGN